MVAIFNVSPSTLQPEYELAVLSLSRPRVVKAMFHCRHVSQLINGYTTRLLKFESLQTRAADPRDEQALSLEYDSDGVEKLLRIQQVSLQSLSHLRPLNALLKFLDRTSPRASKQT